MDKTDSITPETLRELLEYNPETGKLYWKERSDKFFNSSETRSASNICLLWNSRYAGEEALSNVSSNGYLRGGIFDRYASAHRVAWAIYHGEWPRGHLDHINLNRQDNRILNLRSATSSENNCNKNAQSNNTSGFKGVSFNKQRGLWRARISIKKKRYCLGHFETPEDAYKKYCDASGVYHRDFSRTE